MCRSITIMLKRLFSIFGGVVLGQLYYFYFVKDIGLPYRIGHIIYILTSSILGIGNAISVQIRCISLLTLPMYCGKAGRGVLKAFVLTYVIAGPITNMGYNAKEVVRVFACSTELSYNLTEARYKLLARPIKNAILASRTEINVWKDTFSSIKDIVTPIKHEVEGTEELREIIKQRSIMEEVLKKKRQTNETKEDRQPFTSANKTESDIFQEKYLRKLKNRCSAQISRGIFKCAQMFGYAYTECVIRAPQNAEYLCFPLKGENACDIRRYINDTAICDGREQIDPGLGEGYLYLTKVKKKLTENLKYLKLQYKITYERELYNVQDAKETGQKVMHEFEQRGEIMQYAVKIVNICLALMALRVIVAAQSYHDNYLTTITYDNLYITSYFKHTDRRRRLKNKYTLLPLKKMERNKYVDVHSLEYNALQRSRLLTPILKVMLEVVTATTFVMLDRLFFEALEVVGRHARQPVPRQGTKDLEIEVEGTGSVATMIRNVLNSLNDTRSYKTVSNEECLPRPRAMPTDYFVKIYCGYLWILLLLYLNPYTQRLPRLLCSYFYPRREKQRILHLYNDVLKKRMKMQKTLRRKALHAVRAHYLAGESLRSLRMRYPRLLSWLAVLPAARMTCLICEETEPRVMTPKCPWRRCKSPACGFAWCEECWLEAGERCLACDPNLAILSDLDSLSDDRPVKY